MLAWIRSKQEEEEEEIDVGKGNLFYLAREQIKQSNVLLILQVMTFCTSCWFLDPLNNWLNLGN